MKEDLYYKVTDIEEVTYDELKNQDSFSFIEQILNDDVFMSDIISELFDEQIKGAINND